MQSIPSAFRFASPPRLVKLHAAYGLYYFDSHMEMLDVMSRGRI